VAPPAASVGGEEAGGRGSGGGATPPSGAEASPGGQGVDAGEGLAGPERRTDAAGEAGSAATGQPRRPDAGASSRDDRAAAVLAWADATEPQGGGGAARRLPPGPPQERLEELADRLGVPAADRPRFFALHRRFFLVTQEKRLRLDSVRREVRAEMVAAEPDRARIDRLLVQSAELQVDLERALVEHVFEARELLDGEAELRYLHLLSRLGLGRGGRPPAGAAPWQGGRRPGGGPLRRFAPRPRELPRDTPPPG
jgi:hypothetical protein